MNILVTGGTGFIGSHLVDALSRSKNNIRVLVRPNSKFDFLDTSHISLIQGDLRNYESLKLATKNINIVFHLAALTNHKAPKKDLLEVNYIGTINLIKACIVNGVEHFIYCSSAAMNKGSNSIINEDSPIKPEDDYQESKFLAEEFLKKYREYLIITILRPSLVYGPRNLNGFRKTIKSIAKNRIKFFIGPKNKVQGVIYVEDLVQAFLLSMKKKKNDTYIVSTENVKSINFIKTAEKNLNICCLNIHIPVFLTKVILSILGKEKKWIDSSVRNRIYDSSKIRKDLGFKPKVKLKEGLRKTINWYGLNDYI